MQSFYMSFKKSTVVMLFSSHDNEILAMSHTCSVMVSSVEITFRLHFEMPRNKVKVMLICINMLLY
jgi:hypothetical protein